jgi:hypothetical protein
MQAPAAGPERTKVNSVSMWSLKGENFTESIGGY